MKREIRTLKWKCTRCGVEDETRDEKNGYTPDAPEGWLELDFMHERGDGPNLYKHCCPKCAALVKLVLEVKETGDDAVASALVEVAQGREAKATTALRRCGALGRGSELKEHEGPEASVQAVLELVAERDRLRRAHADYFGRWSQLCDVLCVSVEADVDTALFDVRELKGSKASQSETIRILTDKLELAERS